jgi:hypothetical protein
MNDSLYMLKCSSRSYLARYTVIFITSRDCNHITWFSNSASVSLFTTFSHRIWIASDFSSSQLSQKRLKRLRVHCLKIFLQTKISFLLISCTRNRHSTMIENYIERDNEIKCELDRLTFIEIWFIIELHKSLSRNALIIITKWFK